MNNDYKLQGRHVAKFVIMSIIGLFLFVVLLPAGGGTFNIPLGFVINWLGLTLNRFELGGFGLVFTIAAILITVSFLGTVVAWVFKPSFIMDNSRLKDLFLSHPVYFVSKGIAVVLVWMVFFGVGPDWLLCPWDGAGLMMDLIAGGSSGSNLITIFLVLGLAIPLLTDFGIMEFLGMLIRKVVRFLFTLPGRSSIDLMGSWFSSSAASVIITRDQHEKGFYTGREAAAICVNFTIVSLPFTFVIANFIGLMSNFLVFYLVICITVIILAVIMPRIWPLRGIKDEYLPEVGKQIVEEPDPNTSIFSQATRLAAQRASVTTPAGVIKSGLSNWLNIFMDLIPFILAWGTIALVINAQTPIFDIASWPFGQFMRLLGVEYAMNYSSATLVGFFDMFLPAVLLSGQDAVAVYTGYAGDYVEGYGYGYELYEFFVAPIATRFIIGALSIVQIIYMAETGILILKSKIPLNIGHLAIIFLMRTVFALPIIVLLTRILFRG
ncbi:MAG: hypothetical protein FWC70_02760 [Defluviitaleaceae bacterium]|nr:hypothetical protein [Defluviitaleaceae bacterium]